MSQKRLKEGLADKSRFVVVAELTGGPGFDYGPIEKFLKAYGNAGAGAIPERFDFVGVTLPQSPGGVANIAPGDVLNYLTARGLLGDLDVIPHISCKDHNVDAIASSLMGYKKGGIESLLALTGDKPLQAKGVFEIDSVGLLALIRGLNNDAYIKAKPEQLAGIRPFFAGAAVSPFKYTESSQMQQYYKMEKKIAAGAGFFITQVGWDWRKSLELIRYAEENKLDVPIIGNVYLLSTITPAPRLMHSGKLPGCFVSDELFAKVGSETVDDHIERASQQVAMYKSIGAAGVDIGGVPNFEMFTRILQRAAEIGTDWERFKDNLCWPAKDAFYLYDRAGRKVALSRPCRKFKQKFFDFMHRAILDPDYKGFRTFKKIMAALGTQKGSGAVYSLFNASEKALKYLLFDCEECGDCYLPENFALCTVGGCEKGLANAPCGDATVEGKCANELERVCIGELIYQAAAAEAEAGGIEKLRATMNKPRKPALEHTSSILNYLFGKDHTMKKPVISVGESIHASIPKTGRIMKELDALGPDAYSRESGPLNYIRALIESQAADDADYIAVNLDVFAEDDPQRAVGMMRQYVKMVRKWGGGVPVCVDSSSSDILAEGLKEWYNTSDKVHQPLVNSVKVYTVEQLLPLKKEYDFAFVGLLVSEERATGPGGSHSVNELHSLAKRILDAAIGKYGFKSEQIYFDSTVFPLAIDMPMEPNVPGYTYRTFETIKKIKSDPAFKGVHCSLGISNCVRDLPGRRIGVCRAYLAKAMEYGLDAAIINVAHHYGTVEPDPDLMELVDAYAKMDGSAEAMNRAMMLMGKFCQENRKASA